MIAGPPDPSLIIQTDVLRPSLGTRLRRYFLTGLVLAAPLAITASETGHLVLATLHTASAARTLDRILDVFPTDQQDQIRVMVSESLRGVISQQLVPRADGQGRVLALEVLLHNPAVAALIRDGKTFMLPGVMQTARRQGMRLMDDSLRQLVETGVISPSEGFERADNKRQFEALLKGAAHG